MAHFRNPTRNAIADYFDLPYEKARRIKQRDLERLRDCRSVEAMRLLLGISRKKEQRCKKAA